MQLEKYSFLLIQIYLANDIDELILWKLIKQVDHGNNVIRRIACVGSQM